MRSGETIDMQRAVYVALLLDLTKQAAPEAIGGLCDRIERTLATLTQQPHPSHPRRLPYWRVRP